MKKIFLSLLATSFILAGCFETTQEITLNEDGTGTVTTTSDLSSALNLAKQMGGGGEEMEKIATQKVDTSFSLASQADSIQDISPEEKDILRQGIMYMKLDGKEEKFLTKLTFPFSNPQELMAYDKLTNKVFSAKMKDIMASTPAAASMGDAPQISSFEHYYDIKYESGELKKSLNKSKYADAENNQYLKGLQQAAGMGIPITATYIINLPRPADKAEGKNVKLSDDKMKVTVKVDIEDFFSDPEKLEFKIKY